MPRKETHSKTPSRRTVLKIAATSPLIGLISPTVSLSARAQTVGHSFSFEQGLDPWYVLNDPGSKGINEISDERASDGEQSIHLAGGTDSLQNSSAVAVDLDVTPIEKVVHDVYAVSNNPDFGNIKLAIDAPEPLGGENISNVHADIKPGGGGEGVWVRDIEDTTIADYDGVRPFVAFTSLDNEVFWDNFRFIVSTIEVELDIKPGSDPNAIAPTRQGEIPVAIFQTDDFDPTQRVDVSTLRFGAPEVVDGGGGAQPAHSGGHVEDADNDGDDDLVLHFPTQDTGFSGDESQGKLVGKTTDGIPLVGTDSVKIAGQ